jgi:hypothetical protein
MHQEAQVDQEALLIIIVSIFDLSTGYCLPMFAISAI